MDRRHFLRTTLGAAAAFGCVPAFARTRIDKPEELVKKLYESLSGKQKKVVALPWDDTRRPLVYNNWRIVKPSIKRFYTAEQQKLIRDIFAGLLTEDGGERFARSMKDDAGGFGNYACCIFGEPGTKRFEWVLTGRHVTIRCDGDTTPGVAFGGPIFYGHAVEFYEKADHKGNVWWHEARLANKVFDALDGKQRKKALLDDAPFDVPESVEIDAKGPWEGLAVGDMSKDQKALAEDVLKKLLSAYRKTDVDEAMAFVKQGGGLDKIHFSFYKEGDIGKDGVWDIWRLQGPTMSWYFRGQPHVHVWVNIAGRKEY